MESGDQQRFCPQMVKPVGIQMRKQLPILILFDDKHLSQNPRLSSSPKAISSGNLEEVLSFDEYFTLH
jgi:hypothetical protein